MRHAYSATSSIRTPGTSAVARAAAGAGDLHRRRAPRPPRDLRRAQRALLRQQDRSGDHVGRALRPAAPPQLHQDGQLLGRGSPDPHPSLARSRVRAAVLRRVDRVPRDAASGARHPREEWPPRVPLQGVHGRRGAVRALRQARAGSAATSTRSSRTSAYKPSRRFALQV